MRRLLFNYGLADITPEEPVLLAGYANRKGLSKEIHRRLTSRCVVIKQEENILCMVVNDLMDVDPEIINSIKADISGKTGAEEDSILLVSIHSHSAPEMERGKYDANDRYIDLIKKKVTENACSVINGECMEADLFYGKSECDINIARRDIKPVDGSMAYRIGDPDGFTDREVVILQMRDRAGERKVTLFNYACHPVTLGYRSNYISIDYPGRAREVVEEKYDGMAVFVNGATGDLNPRETDHTEPTVTDSEGEKLGNAVISAKLSRDMANPDLRFASGIIRVPFRDQSITKEHIENEFTRKSSDITEFFTWKEMLERWKTRMFEMIDRNETGKSFPFKINAVKLGKTIMFITQGELFVKYQMELKKNFRDHNLLCITYAHGTGAYIATKEAFENKSYEADQAYIYEMMPSPLTPEIEEIYLKGALDIVKELYK